MAEQTKATADNATLPTVKSALLRAAILPVIFVTLVLLGVGWLGLLAPAIERSSRVQADQAGVAVAAHLANATANAGKILNIMSVWLAGGEISFDHETLNRRFMPLLSAFPEITAVRIANAAGGEWMLHREPDGSWLNRLSNPGDREGTRRFLHWLANGTLEREERAASDYAPNEQDWYRNTLEAAPGNIVWGDLQRLPMAGQPGITASLRRDLEEVDLIISLDLALSGAGELLRQSPLRGEGIAILITRDGRLLARSPEADAPGAVLTSVLQLEAQPLQRGIDSWLNRGEQPSGKHTLYADGEFWLMSFHPLALADRELWLGVFIPYSQLIPGLLAWFWLIVGLLAATLIALSWHISRLGAAADEDVDDLISRLRQIGKQNLSAPTRELHSLAEFVKIENELGRARRQLTADSADANREKYAPPSPDLHHSGNKDQ